MTALLDSNVLIALVVSDHVHHDHAATRLYRQATDAYLARKRIGQLATLDAGLAHQHDDVAVLFPNIE